MLLGFQRERSRQLGHSEYAAHDFHAGELKDERLGVRSVFQCRLQPERCGIVLVTGKQQVRIEDAYVELRIPAKENSGSMTRSCPGPI